MALVLSAENVAGRRSQNHKKLSRFRDPHRRQGHMGIDVSDADGRLFRKPKLFCHLFCQMPGQAPLGENAVSKFLFRRIPKKRMKGR